jgi:hypothetical protein
MAGVDVPVVPLRRQWLTTTPLPEVPPEFPFVIDFAQSLYFHREGAGLLTGMSNNDEPIGFDQSVDREWELVHLEAAAKRMPLLERAGVASRWAGLYEVTPDAPPPGRNRWRFYRDQFLRPRVHAAPFATADGGDDPRQRRARWRGVSALSSVTSPEAKTRANTTWCERWLILEKPLSW